MNIALIVFAGKGTRINSPIPKQFIKIKEKELVVYAIEKFQSSPLVDEIVLVTNEDYIDYVKRMVFTNNLTKVKFILPGGKTRQESVKLGLINTNYGEKDKVLIHDGDRPNVDEKIIEENVKYLDEYPAVCTYIKHKDSLKNVSNSGRCKVIDGEDIDVQTPQSFRYGLIKQYHTVKENEVFSDDIGLIEDAFDVKYVEGSPNNFKVTTDIDLDAFKRMI